jgi:dihydropyrimidine dehydrogenase (NAD+) subunit PreT
MKACPVNCSPQEFINHAKNSNFDDAVKTITNNNLMGQTCGLICPDKFCMKACTRANIDFAVNIPKVQATILENYRIKKEDYSGASHNGMSVAIIGAGPAGIAAAPVLVNMGYKVAMFEASDKVGGALNMIPESRLPYNVIEKDWDYIFDEDYISLELNKKIDNLEELLAKFDGIIVATGEPNSISLNVPGEEHSISYKEYLLNPEKYKTDGKVAIIGGGNVAADCAFTAKINGASSIEMFVRRRLSDMKISKKEYMELIDYQVDISVLNSPQKIEKKGKTFSLFVGKNHFIDGKIEQVPNSTIELPSFSLIIKAIGSRADPKIENERIIYAGDCKHGGSTIVEAISSGRSAAVFLNAKLTRV